MNKKNKSDFLRHFVYVFGSQMVVLVSGLVKTLVIPVFIGLSDFGYWQIYIFYTLYIGVFTFGYGDGLYLKYGGFKFNDLPLNKIRSANILYLSALVCSSVLVGTYAVFNADPYRTIVFLAIAANVLILGVISIISLTLQATNLLRGYAFINAADKIFFCLALLPLIGNSFRTVEYLIAIDLVAKGLVLALLFHRYHQLYIGPVCHLYTGAKEFLSSSISGGALLLANLTGMLVLGVGRIVIEYLGEIESYAYYAFAVSLSNIVLMSVTALSVIAYPSLKRQNSNNYLMYFDKINKAYSILFVVMLFGYFPVVVFINAVARKYIPVLQFLNIILLITVLQGKMQLVNNTFYKVLRLERPMLVANATSLIIATVLSLVGFFLFHSVLVIAYSALVTMLFRVYASEIFIRKQIGGVFDFHMFLEIGLLGIFILITLLLTPLLAAVTWLLVVTVFMLYKRQALSETWLQLRSGNK